MKVENMAIYSFIRNNKEFESIRDIKFILVTEIGVDLLETKSVLVGKTLFEVLDEYKEKDLERLNIYIYRNTDIMNSDESNSISDNDGKIKLSKLSLLDAINTYREIVIDIKADDTSFFDRSIVKDMLIISKYIKIQPKDNFNIEDYFGIDYDHIITEVCVKYNKILINSYFRFRVYLKEVN